MGVETATYVADLVITNPLGTDAKSQGDDHLRLIKTTVKNTFPGFTGIVMATGAEAGAGNAYAVTLSPAPASYTPLLNSVVVFKSTHANSGAATLNVNGLGAKTIKDIDGNALASGEIANGAVVAVLYDGTDFFVLSGNDKAHRAGDTYAGTHNFTAAAINVPTAAPGDADNSAASTSFVDSSFGKIAGQTWTGTHGFTGATINVATQLASDNTTKAASTAFVQQVAFSAALPNQTGNAGKQLQTDGSSASWVMAVPPQTGHANHVLTTNGTTTLWAPSPSAPDVIVEDQKASGTIGRAYGVLSWVTVPLNTLVRNNGSVASLASDAVTLPAGTWLIEFDVPFTGTAGLYEARGRARLYNDTDATVIAQGRNARSAQDAAGAVSGSAESSGTAIVTFASSKAVKLQIYVTNNANGGYALSTGAVEVFAQLRATRVA